MASASEFIINNANNNYGNIHEERNSQDKSEAIPSSGKSVQFNPEVVIHDAEILSSGEPSLTSTIHESLGYLFNSFEKLPISNWIHYKKEDLIAYIMHLMREKDHFQQREREARDQVKKSIVLVEEIKFEKSEVELANEQLKKEINGLEKKIDLLNVEHEKNVAQVKLLSTEEWNQKMMDVQCQMESVLENQAKLYSQFENISQDKINLLNNLEQMKSYNQELEKELEKLTVNMKAEIIQALLEKDETIAEFSQLRYKMMKEKRDYQLEIDMLQLDNDNLKRHLKETENNLLNAKEECVQLSQTINKIQKNPGFNHISSEQNYFNKDFITELKNFQLREQQMQNFIKELQEKYNKTTEEMTSIITSQRTLIKKFSTECILLSQKMKEFYVKHRNDKIILKTQLDEFRGRLEHNRLYRKQLQNQCEQHRNVHMAMGSQLQTLRDKLTVTREQMHDLLNYQKNLNQQITR